MYFILNYLFSHYLNTRLNYAVIIIAEKMTIFGLKISIFFFAIRNCVYSSEPPIYCHFRIPTMAQVLDIGDYMSLPEDTLVYKKNIDEKIAAKCFYDAVMGAFVTRLYKPDNLDTGIGLRMRAMRLIMVLFQRLDAVCLFVCLFVFNDAPTLMGH